MQQKNTWQPVNGTRFTRLYTHIRKPDIISSNSFLIETPDQIIIIDPGGLKSQWDLLIDKILPLFKQKKRPLLILLSHCHIDHCHIVNQRLRLPKDMECLLAIHTLGAKTLQTGDNKMSMAELYGYSLEKTNPDIRLMSGEDDTVVDLGYKTGRPFLQQCLPLGSDDILHIYHTPGHSPDSICIRLGDTLFISDLLSAANPMVAGIVGWNHEEFINSINNILWLLETTDITICYPGHGPAMDAETVAKRLHRVADEARGLKNITEVNKERLYSNKQYAVELLEEVSDVFTIIAGRLFLLAHYLEYLDEKDEADKYLDMLNADIIEDSLQTFNGIVNQVQTGEKLDLHLVFAAMKVVHRIMKEFDQRQLEQFIDQSYLRRASRLLSDFLTVIRGFSHEVNNEKTDVNMLVTSLLEEINKDFYADSSILDTIDDNTHFLTALAARISHVPIFDKVNITFNPDNTIPYVLIDPLRFKDYLQGLLEQYVVAAAKEIALSSGKKQGVTCLYISATNIGRENIPERKLNAHIKRFQACGVQFNLVASASGEQMIVLTFSGPGLLSIETDTF